MAFNPQKDNIKKALNHVENKKQEQKQPKDGLVIPVFKDTEERTRTYTFTLQPSVRKQLDVLAKEHNFKSSSKFLNELIKNMQ